MRQINLIHQKYAKSWITYLKFKPNFKKCPNIPGKSAKYRQFTMVDKTTAFNSLQQTINIIIKCMAIFVFPCRALAITYFLNHSLTNRSPTYLLNHPTNQLLHLQYMYFYIQFQKCWYTFFGCLIAIYQKYISIELPDAFYWGAKDPWPGMNGSGLSSIFVQIS